MKDTREIQNPEIVKKVRVFLDTSALFAGIWSASRGARMILKLGESGAIQIVISSQVLSEIDLVLRKKLQQSLPALALLLDKSQVQVASATDPALLASSKVLTSHPRDARLLAEAWAADIDYLVTHDQEHFLDNQALREAVPFEVRTPGDFLAWYRARLASYGR